MINVYKNGKEYSDVKDVSVRGDTLVIGENDRRTVIEEVDDVDVIVLDSLDAEDYEDNKLVGLIDTLRNVINVYGYGVISKEVGVRDGKFEIRIKLDVDCL